jgi:DNA polymerase-3 subunit alpha
MVTPLHVHTMYSNLDGFSTPDEVGDRAVQIGACACGCTDHGLVTAHLDFAKAMISRGIKPVFGSELYHGLKATGFKGRERDQSHLIALAMTDEGLRNLWCLVDRTSQYDHFHNVGRVFWDDLRDLHKGIHFTSACALGMVPQALLLGDTGPLNQYLDLLGDDFSIEISTYPSEIKFADQDSDDSFDQRLINEALVQVAQERGIMMTYGDDGHYAFPAQAQIHDAYIARQTGQSIFTPVEERKMYHPPNALVIKDEAMVRENLWYLGDNVVNEILANTAELAEKVDAQLPDVRRHLPVFMPNKCPWLESEAKTLTPEELFIDLVTVGITERYGEDAREEVWDRTFYEVDTLIRDGIHHYFLMGWDEMQIANSLGIERGPGRGSSAGSIVAYALGITDVDPLHYDLIFERFWNSGRAKGFPDIDTDFSRARRQEMITALKDRHGADHVVAIGTTGYLKPKATIDKLMGALGITYKEADELKEIVGKTTKIEILGHEQIGWNPELEPGKKYYVKRDCGDEIEEWIKAGALPKVFSEDVEEWLEDPNDREDLRRYFVEVCEHCCSRVSQYGIHASGLVVCDEAFASIVPTYRRGGKENGQPATMFDMSEVDALMIVKLDVLGLRTLDVLEYWRDAMRDKQDVAIKWSGLDLEEHPQEMWDMLAQGFTAGIFQVEDGYGKQLCKALRPSSVLDLSAIGALNRPGPIQAKIPDHYIARRNGVEEVTYIHPRFEELMSEILRETYGLFVYQEQIIRYFNALDFTLGESDAIRKIMGKKKPEQMDAVRDGLDEWEGRGYLDMAVKAGIPLEVAQTIWNDLEGFADYCFNKSHSVAYGIVGFRTLYAKYYGASEFYAACIRSLDPSTDGDKRKTLLPQFVNECRRQKINVYGPDIRYSMGYPWVTEEDDLYFGFCDIAGVRSSGEFVADLRDKYNLPTEDSTIFTEAFEAFNEDWNKEKKRAVKAGEIATTEKSPKMRLNVKKLAALVDAGTFNDLTQEQFGEISELSMSQRQAIEAEFLGVVLSDNVAEVMEANADKIAELDDYTDLLMTYESKVTTDEEQDAIEYMIPGCVSQIVEKYTRKSNEQFGIITVEYEGQEATFMVWPREWKNKRSLFKIRTPGIFTILHKPATQYGESYVFQSGKILKAS